MHKLSCLLKSRIISKIRSFLVSAHILTIFCDFLPPLSLLFYLTQNLNEGRSFKCRHTFSTHFAKFERPLFDWFLSQENCLFISFLTQGMSWVIFNFNVHQRRFRFCLCSAFNYLWKIYFDNSCILNSRGVNMTLPLPSFF